MPAAANACAIAKPMPDVAPVTIAVLDPFTIAKILGAVLRVKFFGVNERKLSHRELLLNRSRHDRRPL
jgi:hypothetical protein